MRDFNLASAVQESQDGVPCQGLASSPMSMDFGPTPRGRLEFVLAQRPHVHLAVFSPLEQFKALCGSQHLQKEALLRPADRQLLTSIPYQAPPE